MLLLIQQKIARPPSILKKPQAPRLLLICISGLGFDCWLLYSEVSNTNAESTVNGSTAVGMI
jgi:hypothetical protein